MAAWGARAGLVLVAALSLVVFAGYAFRPTFLGGDCPEYVYMVVNICDHGTPNLTSSSLALARQVTPYRADRDLPFGFFRGKSGAAWGYHFWGYPLLATPMALLTSRLGNAAVPADLHSLNILLFGLAVFVCWRWTDLSRRRRALFVLLGAWGPVLGYLCWASPEVFTWTCLMLSFTALSRRRYELAALAAAFGAVQNPGLICFSIAAAGLSFAERHPRRAVVAVCSCLPGAVPILFSLAVFGVPNKIAAEGFASPHWISGSKAVSFWFDLNQGLLGCVPVLVLSFSLALVTVFRAYSLARFLNLGAILGAMLVSESAVNWNNDCAGLSRTCVWLLPAIAYFSAEALPRSRLAWTVVAAGIGLQSILLWEHSCDRSYLDHAPLAKFVLDRWPWLYNPVPEIFVERTLHRDGFQEPRGLTVTYYAATWPGNRLVYVKKKTLVVGAQGRYSYFNY